MAQQFLLDIHPKEVYVHKEICTEMSITALCIKAKNWKQPSVYQQENGKQIMLYVRSRKPMQEFRLVTAQFNISLHYRGSEGLSWKEYNPKRKKFWGFILTSL